jgi:hypothetical protein
MKDDPDGAVAATAEILRFAFSGRLAPDAEDKFPYVLVLALAGWEPAHRALCDYASRLTAEQKPLPHPLQLYIVMAAREGFKARKKPFKTLERDVAISVAVRELVDAGHSPTRNVATLHTPSACSLVAEALSQLGHHMTEAAVEKIWNRKGRDLLTEPPMLS